MKTYRTRIIYILIIFFAPLLVLAQNGNRCNLNITNGLLTNHIYSTITDRHGYLWLATDNGVVRYNGYDLKYFTTDDGLPVNDVWQLIEDEKGRIWLGSITNKMGYIYNEKYTNAIFHNPNSHTIYPTFFKLNNGHVNFFSNSRSDNLHESYFEEHNDTIFDYVLTDELKKILPELQITGSDFQTIIPISNEEGKTIILYNNCIYHFRTNHGSINILSKVPTNEKHLTTVLGLNNFLFVDDFLVLHYYDNRNYLDVFNINNGNNSIIRLTDIGVNEPILNVIHNNSQRDKLIYIITNRHIIQYKLDKTLEYLTSTSFKKDLEESAIYAHNITSFVHDDLWGTCITTAADGLFLKSDEENHITKNTQIKLKDYQYLGGDDSYCIWVNKSNDICIIDQNSIVSRCHIIDKQETLYATVKKKNGVYYLLGKENYELDIKGMRVKRLYNTALGVSIFKMIQQSPQKYYCINTTGLYKINPDSGVISKKYIECDRYRDLIYDSLRNTYWAYNYNKITTVKNDQTKIILQDQFTKFGIKRAEKIVIDNKYGNIFFKGNESITMYDYEAGNFCYLFANLNAKESTIAVYDDVLVVYGRFGFAFCKILGKGRLSTPVYYRNIKNEKFNFIYAAQFAFRKVIINTDMGVFAIIIPDKFPIVENEQYNDKYKFNYFYKNKINELQSGDTICLDQIDNSIRFDLINPYGNGPLKYQIINGNMTTVLNSNELFLPTRQLLPDNYINISLSAYDNVWRSKPIKIIIYITPYWWQTRNMQRTIWITGFLLVVMFFAGSILITRRLVLNASKKRNLRMEMELKAIYSQINPHFIFNSLNSALLLVSKNKMDEAYVHISKFSRLLRSYIKSSRNKFITAQEEIINLQNYIELQQIRFKDRFSYDINTDRLTNKAVKIPALLLQPFVENAIEHGLLNNLHKGHLSVDFSMTNDTTLVCTIDDNGIGREEAKIISGMNLSKEESYGNLLIKDLVKIFNKYENVNVDIAYIDKTLPATGTTVTITIKYLK